MVKSEDPQLSSNLAHKNDMEVCARQIIHASLELDKRKQEEKQRKERQKIPLFKEGALEALRNRNDKEIEMENT